MKNLNHNKMEKLIQTLFLCLFSISIFGQEQSVGIGTDNLYPSIILQIESTPQPGGTYYGGVLFPRVSLTATNVFAPVIGTPVMGLMVYNTNTSSNGNTAVYPGFYYWDTTLSAWVRMAQDDANDTALFSNQNTTTDLNSGATVYADLFANVRFNNDTSLYQKIDNTTLKINKVGYYKVILNLDLTNGSGTSDNFGIEILVNNSNTIITDKYYIPGRATSNASLGKSVVFYVPINVAGYTLRFRTYEIDPGTSVYFKNPNTSTISIERLK